MEKWCKCYEENFSGGKMRGDRGEDIEQFVKNVVKRFNDLYNIDVVSMKGNKDKKEL